MYIRSFTSFSPLLCSVKIHFNKTFNNHLFYHNLNELRLDSINHSKQMSSVFLLFNAIFEIADKCQWHFGNAIIIRNILKFDNRTEE